jgi:outer membrane receptor protein involved in Fe transport
MGINALRSAIRVALSTSAGAGVLGVAGFVPSAQAQVDIPAGVDEITVTGSAIPRADLSSASPITVLGREEMLATGIRDVGDLLQRMPSMSGSPIGTTTNNGGTGTVEIDLRGMGVDRTVTLVNGRRLVDGGDYQTIPPIMIERVEILKDGASAIYGADAVAGVVNIITRTDFDGISVDVQNADFFDMNSGAMNTVSAIAGTTFDTGNFVFGAEYVDQEEAYQRDAPWDFFQNSYYIYPGPNQGCEAHPTLPYTGTPEGGCYVLGSSRIEEGRFLSPPYGQLMAPAGGLVPWDGRTYNYAPVNYIQTPYKRTNVFAEANFDLTDTVRFGAALRGNFRESAQELAPLPYTTESDPAYPVVIGGNTFQGISVDNYYLVQAFTAAGLAPVPVQNARRRMSEIPRSFTQDVTQYEAQFTLSGDVGNVGWDAYYNTGRRNRVDQDYGQFSGGRLYNALGPSADFDGDGTPSCYVNINDPASEIEGCVPLNLFGGPGTVPADQLLYVGVNLIDNRLTEQSIVGLTLNGEAFDLRGGPLGWAVGVNYWAQTFLYSPDSAKQQDAVTGNTGFGTDGSLYSTGIFAELLAPVTESFTVKLGVRNDDYTQLGGETTYQVGLEFRATDTFKLRATSSTVFRAPTIEDLYEGTQDDFPTYNDPCIPPVGTALPPGCAQTGVQYDSQLLAKVGGNPSLIPETGDTLTAGMVWTPDFLDGGLSLTIDYWTIEIEDGISSLGVQYILDTCYEEQNAQSCSLVFRAGDYSIDYVIDASLNVAQQGAEGVDTEIRYRLGTDSGQLEFAFLWSHLLERTKTPSPGAPEQDLSARYTDITAEDGGAYARDKINYSVQWQINNLTIGYLGEYISALDADTFCNCGPVVPYIQKIDSYLYHDIVLNYDFGMGSQISFGATDITDEEPPFIEIGFNATTDPSTYRMFGRGYYVRFTQNFN